ncbi:hypothetical protein DI005_28380 [Prauserella sp. PE36]|uniref:Imm1 family immunity protein n=1 Tax=Prauserella sp. PE36 TaxID=1504709 RepID=UPI000DE40305|nr:Imm1 family immunity protein [Prauserella sp. PE36]RBM15242.1 hypothetical protein DI005_28380 [Prauserella sp. PE36]
MSTTLRAQPAYDVTTIPDADELLRIMDNVNRELARPPEAGVVWELYSGEDGEHVLVVGIRGDRGCLSWAEPSELQLPVNGLNVEPVEYFTWDGHQYDQDPGSEVPIETMHAAVREYVTTRQRPTCVQWVAAPP